MKLSLASYIKIQLMLWELGEELNGEWVPDWNDLTQWKYSIYFDHHPDHKRFKFREYKRGDNLGVMFSEEAAKQACIVLDMEFKLNGEQNND